MNEDLVSSSLTQLLIGKKMWVKSPVYFPFCQAKYLIHDIEIRTLTWTFSVPITCTYIVLSTGAQLSERKLVLCYFVRLCCLIATADGHLPCLSELPLSELAPSELPFVIMNEWNLKVELHYEQTSGPFIIVTVSVSLNAIDFHCVWK